MGKLLAAALVLAALGPARADEQGTVTPPPAAQASPAPSSPAPAKKARPARKAGAGKAAAGEKEAGKADPGPEAAKAPAEKPCEPVKPCAID